MIVRIQYTVSNKNNKCEYIFLDIIIKNSKINYLLLILINCIEIPFYINVFKFFLYILKFLKFKLSFFKLRQYY